MMIGKVKLLRVGAREPGVAVGAPLHGGAHAVAVAEVDVVAHADLVAVVDDRRAGQGEEEDIDQFDLAPVVAKQGSEAAADAEVDARALVGGVHAVHVIALLVGHHLQGQFVVVAQERWPTGNSAGWPGVCSMMSTTG